MENLAHTTSQTNEAFIGSKVALRSHIIHLYAGEHERGMLHPVRKFPLLSYAVS